MGPVNALTTFKPTLPYDLSVVFSNLEGIKCSGSGRDIEDAPNNIKVKDFGKILNRLVTLHVTCLRPASNDSAVL